MSTKVKNRLTLTDKPLPGNKTKSVKGGAKKLQIKLITDHYESQSQTTSKIFQN